MDRVQILKAMGVATWVSTSNEEHDFDEVPTSNNNVTSYDSEQSSGRLVEQGITMKWTIVMDSIKEGAGLFSRIRTSIKDLGVQLDIVEIEHNADLSRHLLDCEMVLALGAKAAAALSGENDSIENLRGIIFETQNANGEDVPVLVSYHPSQLIKQPSKKTELWDDIVWARSIWIESRL